MSLLSRLLSFFSSFIWGRRHNDTLNNTTTTDEDDDSWLDPTRRALLRQGLCYAVEERVEVTGWAPWEGDEDWDEAELVRGGEGRWNWGLGGKGGGVEDTEKRMK